MNEERPAIHFVCTHEEARALIEEHGRFWISNCGCREERGGCQRSRIDVCLYFSSSFPRTGSRCREVRRQDALELLDVARTANLVSRPFRDDQTRARTEGICFCCDDCCGYFLNPYDRCDKGALIEATDRTTCDDCGLCVDVCYFGARSLVDARVEVAPSRCHGCGLCLARCPRGSITMTARR